MSTIAKADGCQFSLTSVLATLTAISAWFAIGTAMRLSLTELVGCAAILAFRPFVIFCPRKLAISIPLMAILLAIPIFISWDTIHYAWNSSKRPDPLSDWILWLAFYSLPPLAVWAIDMCNEYNSVKQQALRLVGDIIFLILWAFICIELLHGDMAYHHT